jgi:hypothetical protein
VATTLTRSLVTRDPSVEVAVQDFVITQMAGLPGHVQMGVRATEVVLAAACVARHRQPFERLDDSEQEALVRGWQTSAVPLPSQYVRLVRSLVLFSAYEQLHPLAPAVR